jgi:hypothetical protein
VPPKIAPKQYKTYASHGALVEQKTATAKRPVKQQYRDMANTKDRLSPRHPTVGALNRKAEATEKALSSALPE